MTLPSFFKFPGDGLSLRWTPSILSTARFSWSRWEMMFFFLEAFILLIQWRYIIIKIPKFSIIICSLICKSYPQWHNMIDKISLWYTYWNMEISDLLSSLPLSQNKCSTYNHDVANIFRLTSSFLTCMLSFSFKLAETWKADRSQHVIIKHQDLMSFWDFFYCFCFKGDLTIMASLAVRWGSSMSSCMM